MRVLPPTDRVETPPLVPSDSGSLPLADAATTERSEGGRPESPGAAQGLSYVPYLHAGQGLSFPTRRAVELAAGLVEASTTPWAPKKGVVRRFALELGPGMVRVRSVVTGDDRRDLEPVPVRADECLRSRCPLAAAILAPDRSASSRTRGAILAWSAKSRTNMVRTMTSLDWAPVLDAPTGWRPVMLTLTLPGDWVPLAPTGKDFKRLVRAFLERWNRKYGRRLAGCWKLEFQRRGAPHLHIYCAAPTGAAFREWLSRTWYEVVGSGDERHLAAGTGIDWGEGIRASDPKRLAIYFAKRAATHNTAASKEYQHIVPEAWRGDGAGPGRFWGYWSLEKCTETVELDAVQFVRLRRTMRRWVESQGRTRDHRRFRVDRETGEVLAGRKVRRRYRVRSLSGAGSSLANGAALSGGFLLVNDAPRWLAQAVGRGYLAAGDGSPTSFRPALP